MAQKKMHDGMLKALELLLNAARTLRRKVADAAPMRGDVAIWKIYPDDRKELVFSKKNLIVRNGKTIMARLLGGDLQYAGQRHLSKIAFGTNGAEAIDTQTSLGASQFIKAAVATYPAFNQLRLTTTMENVEGGSHTYRELGLLSHTGDILFSRIVIGAIQKSTAYKIHVEWTISIQ